jgi:hypothetical protein
MQEVSLFILKISQQLQKQLQLVFLTRHAMSKELDAVEEGSVLSSSRSFAESTTHNLSEAAEVPIKPEIGGIENKRVFYSRILTVGVLMVCAALGAYFTYQITSNDEENAFENGVSTIVTCSTL